MSFKNQLNSGYFFFKPFSADRLFCDLPPKTQKSLTRLKNIKRFQKDKIVINTGVYADVCMLCRGQAKLILNAELYGEDSGRLVNTNEVFGLTETITNCPYQMSLITLTPCLFEMIPRQNFLDFLTDEPELCFNLLNLLAQDLNQQCRLFSSTTF